MLINATILPDLVYQIDFERGASGYFQLLTDVAGDIPFFLGNKFPDKIVLNRCVNDVWDAEILLHVDESFPSVNFKFNGGHMEVWTSHFAADYRGFDAVARRRARFARLQGGRSTGAQLAPVAGRLEDVLASIEAHALHLRIDSLEKRLSALATGNA